MSTAQATSDAQIRPTDATDTRHGLAALADRAFFGALLLVLVMSPFEAAYPPLARIAGLTVTNLEAALLLLGAAWALRLLLEPAARLRLLRHPLLLPVLALLGAAVAATIFGEYTSLGPHYIYRLLMGTALLFAAAEALNGRARLFAALGTILAAGAISAAVGLLEFAPLLDIQPWLTPFKPMPTTVGGVLRLSGTFEYANGAALFFELTLPLLLGVLIALHGNAGAARKTWRRALLLACVVALAVNSLALLLTLSRAAVIGFTAALLFIALAALLKARREHDRRLIGRVLPSLALALGVLALGGLYLLATQPMFSLRLTTENDRNWYRAAVTAAAPPALAAGQLTALPLTVRNDGSMIWRAQGALMVRLSYHWLKADGHTYAVFDGARTLLPHDVDPGDSVSTNATVLAPATPGDYFLQWDLVQENVTWFTMKNLPTGDTTFAVAIGSANGKPAAVVPPSNLPTPINAEAIGSGDDSAISRTQLWRVAFAMFKAHPLFGVGPDAFRLLYGKYAGVTRWNSNIYTNNTYIEMFTNLGLVGGLVFLLLAGLALWRAGRNLLFGRIGAAWAVGLGVTAAIVAFFVHGFADYFLFSTPMYTIFWFLLGVSVLWPRMADEAQAEDQHRGRPL